MIFLKKKSPKFCHVLAPKIEYSSLREAQCKGARNRRIDAKGTDLRISSRGGRDVGLFRFSRERSRADNDPLSTIFVEIVFRPVTRTEV